LRGFAICYLCHPLRIERNDFVVDLNTLKQTNFCNAELQFRSTASEYCKKILLTILTSWD
jgi:hypothetical protein